MKKNKYITIALLLVFIAFNFVIVFQYFFPTTTGLGMNGTLKWTPQTEEFVENNFGHCNTDREKVEAFRTWVIENIQYTPYNTPLIQAVNVDEVIENKAGICFEQASLFTIFCRIEGIECYNVDGRHKNNYSACHSWNRFCIDGKWYDIDITNDQTALKTNKALFGIREVNGKNATDAVFNIYRIY